MNVFACLQRHFFGCFQRKVYEFGRITLFECSQRTILVVRKHGFKFNHIIGQNRNGSKDVITGTNALLLTDAARPDMIQLAPSRKVVAFSSSKHQKRLESARNLSCLTCQKHVLKNFQVFSRVSGSKLTRSVCILPHISDSR